MALVLVFGDFSGSAIELSQYVRKGKIPHRDLPVLDLVNQAMGQLEALGLTERAELLPILSELILFKLRAFAKRPQVFVEEENEYGEDLAPNLLETLIALEDAISFLTQRAAERARIMPVPASPLPRDNRVRPLPVQVLLRAAEPFARRAELLLEPDTFSLREAWERLKGFLFGARRALFSRMPLKNWAEQVVGFTALLEAKKQGEIQMTQEDSFEEIEVQYLAEDQQALFGEAS